MRYNVNFKDNNFLTPTTYTQELSEYAEKLKFEDLPPEVVERAKLILIHTIGAALAAKDTEIAKNICEAALEANNGEGGPTTVWGKGVKMSAMNAAWVLGTLSDTLDWEDCSWTGHPSAGVVPCAWLAAEERKKSGKELIAGIVAAYEVYQRIAMAIQPSLERWQKKGWGLSSWQIFACTVAVCKLYGLDARKINQAITMSCEGSVIPAGVGTDFYHYEYGYRARDGFLFTKAVEKGINNNLDGLDDPGSYISVMCGEVRGVPGEKPIIESEADISWLTKDLGERYLIMETLLKHWPANMWVQTPVEIIADLHKEHGFTPDDVEEIILDPPINNRMRCPDDGFDNVMMAQFSVPYVVSVMLHHPVPGAHWYTPEMIRDPKVIEFMHRVKGGTSPAQLTMEGFYKFRKGEYPMSTMTVKLKDGRELVGKMDCHPGHPKNMMSREEIIDRFRIQAVSALGEEKLERVITLLCNIEFAEDLSEIAELLK